LRRFLFIKNKNSISFAFETLKKEKKRRKKL